MYSRRMKFVVFAILVGEQGFEQDRGVRGVVVKRERERERGRG